MGQHRRQGYAGGHTCARGVDNCLRTKCVYISAAGLQPGNAITVCKL